MAGPFDRVDFELAEAAPDAMIVADATGTIVYANELAAQMFGMDRRVLQGSSVETLIPAELQVRHQEHRAAYMRDARPRPMSTGLRLEGQRASGERFPVEISLSPVENEGTSFVVAAIRDVTDRERSEEELRSVQAELAMSEERDRIARDLHDTVIQQLFAIGMTLQSLVGSLTDPELSERLDWAVDELDRTIREVRTVIFGLQAPRGEGGLRSQIMFLAHEARRTLGFEPRVRFTGLVDTAVTDQVAEQVVLAAREALANVVRHANATEVAVAVRVADGRIRLVVADDGNGIDPATPRGHGLRNLEERAGALRGTCSIETNPGAGTTVTWDVPVA
jgi:PAS domain S-box-containing protein